MTCRLFDQSASSVQPRRNAMLPTGREGDESYILEICMCYVVSGLLRTHGRSVRDNGYGTIVQLRLQASRVFNDHYGSATLPSCHYLTLSSPKPCPSALVSFSLAGTSTDEVETLRGDMAQMLTLATKKRETSLTQPSRCAPSHIS